MISCYHLTIDGPDEGRPLLDDVSFELEDGDWVEFVGPTGAGKSLLFSVLTLENRPTEGRLVVGGRNLERLDRTGFAELRRDIGSCRQAPELLEERNVIENLVVPLLVRGETRRAAEVGERLLESCRLAALREAPVGRLSDGERHLVGLLRAVIGTPRLVAVDGGLDALSGDALESARQALTDSYESGSSIVLFGRSASGIAPDGATLFEVEAGRVDRASEEEP